MTRYVLALDQGTTSSRAILFDARGNAVASAQRELLSTFPIQAGSSMTPSISGTASSRPLREALAAAKATAHDIVADRHRQPARDHDAVGSEHRRPARSAQSSGRTVAQPICAKD